MQGYKRSRLEIVVDVLGLLNEGYGKPTNLMYMANLSWKPLIKVLSLLKEQWLIREHSSGKRRTYKITSQGLQLLATLKHTVQPLLEHQIFHPSR